MPSEARGRLLAVTGIDGCGKTTQAQRLAAWLAQRDGRSEATAATGGWRLERVDGEFIGDLVQRISKADLALPPDTATLLFAANLSFRLHRHVRPALAEGRTLVEDDYAFKVMARALAHGLPEAWVDAVFRDVPEPDLTVLLDLSPRAALARIGDRVTLQEAGLDADDRARGFLDHQARVRDALLGLARRRGWAVVPAEGRSEDAVERDVRRRVEAALAEVVA